MNRTDQRLRLFRIGQGQFNSAQLPIRTVTETLDITVCVSLRQVLALRVESPARLQADRLEQCITIRLGKWPVRAVGRLQEVPFRSTPYPTVHSPAANASLPYRHGESVDCTGYAQQWQARHK